MTVLHATVRHAAVRSDGDALLAGKPTGCRATSVDPQRFSQRATIPAGRPPDPGTAVSHAVRAAPRASDRGRGFVGDPPVEPDREVQEVPELERPIRPPPAMHVQYALYRARVEVAELAQRMTPELPLQLVGQVAAEPVAHRSGEALLGPPDNLAGQQVAHRPLEDVLALAAADLLLRGHAHGQLAELVVEER